MIHLETFKICKKKKKACVELEELHIKSDQASTGEMFVLIIFSERSETDIFKYIYK